MYFECQSCGWQGSESELICSEEDEVSDKPVNQIIFDRCPECGSDEIDEMDDLDVDMSL